MEILRASILKMIDQIDAAKAITEDSYVPPQLAV